MNRQRFEDHGLIRKFFDRVVAEALASGLVSDGADDDEPGKPAVHFRDEKRSNQSHRSFTDAESPLAHKGKSQPQGTPRLSRERTTVEEHHP